MNKILIGKKIESNSDLVKIDGNNITLCANQLFEIEYTGDRKQKVTFNIMGDTEILEYSYEDNMNINNHYIVNNGALNIYKFCNNINLLEDIDIDLCQRDSTVNYKFSGINRGKWKHNLNINHLCDSTKSDINNKVVAITNSKTDFVINSKVIKKAVKSELNQTTRIVTMGDADAKVSPNMFIDLEDVEAKHGSIIGTFKDEDIFYIMSKGISYNDTLKLLIKGYLLSNMINNHEIRKKIMDIIDEYWR